MIAYIKNALRGCLEILLFLPQGLERFKNTKPEFIKSLLVPFLFIFLQLPLARANPELAHLDVTQMTVLVTYRVVVESAIFLLLAWVACWPLERVNEFYRFGTIYNWLTIPAYFLVLPYALLVGTGAASVAQLGGYMAFVYIFYCALVTFVAQHALRTRWGIALIFGLLPLLAEITVTSLLGQAAISIEVPVEAVAPR